MTDKSKDRISQLFQSYRESLPVRLQELETAWAELEASWDEERANEFDMTCHGLAGSALTFDCDKVGDIARQIEILFKPELDNSQPVRAGLYEEIRSLLSELSGAIRKVNE